MLAGAPWNDLAILPSRLFIHQRRVCDGVCMLFHVITNRVLPLRFASEILVSHGKHCLVAKGNCYAQFTEEKRILFCLGIRTHKVEKSSLLCTEKKN